MLVPGLPQAQRSPEQRECPADRFSSRGRGNPRRRRHPVVTATHPAPSLFFSVLSHFFPPLFAAPTATRRRSRPLHMIRLENSSQVASFLMAQSSPGRRLGRPTSLSSFDIQHSPRLPPSSIPHSAFHLPPSFPIRHSAFRIQRSAFVPPSFIRRPPRRIRPLANWAFGVKRFVAPLVRPLTSDL